MTKDELNSLYLKERENLYYLSFSFLNNKEQAEDAIQNAFVKLIEAKFEIENPTHFLRKITKNICLNFLRESHRREEREKIFIDKQEIDNLSIEKCKEENYKVANILNKLPEEIRTTIIYKCIEKMKYAEIAEELGLSVEGIKTRLSKGYRIIREEMTLFFCFLKNN